MKKHKYIYLHKPNRLIKSQLCMISYLENKHSIVVYTYVYEYRIEKKSSVEFKLFLLIISKKRNRERNDLESKIIRL